MLYFKYMQTREKGLLFFLTLIAIVAMAVGIFQLYQTIYAPLRVDKGVKSLTESDITAQVQTMQYILSLQSQDTDADGISDFDEIYTYKTSQYLSDNDSVTFDDKSELSRETDPLCHEGSDCSVEPITPTPVYEEPQEVPQIPENSAQVPKLTAEDLRTLLKESGMSDEQLNAFSNEELLQMWQGTQ